MITCHNVFNVWPKTTLLLPVWPRDTKRLDAPAVSRISAQWTSAQAAGSIARLWGVLELVEDCGGLRTAGAGMEKADAGGRRGFHKYLRSCAEMLGLLTLTSDGAVLGPLPI